MTRCKLTFNISSISFFEIVELSHALNKGEEKGAESESELDIKHSQGEDHSIRQHEIEP
jgi:hypothetical protein